MTALSPPLRVGDLLEGYCDGWFGRDSYGDKRVEAVGADWVVVREIEEPKARPTFAHHPSPDDLARFRRVPE